MTTCGRSLPNACALTVSKSMSFAGGSRVRTCPQQGFEQGSTANALAFGENLPDSLAKFDPPTSSWRTSQICWLEAEADGLAEFLETWPRAGMMQSGTAFRRRSLAPLIAVTGFTLWPTPNASDWKAGFSNAPNRSQSSLPRSIGIVMGVNSGRRGGPNPQWTTWIMGFPMMWLNVQHARSAMPSSRKSRKRSVAPSSP